MATPLLEVRPCTFPITRLPPGSGAHSSSFSNESGENWMNNDEFKIGFNATHNASSFLTSTFYYQQRNSSVLDWEDNSTFPLVRPVTLRPADSLITNPVFLTLTFASILGNLAMIGVILLTPQFRKPANYLIVNLSLSSLLFILSANMRLVENAYFLWDYTTFRCSLLAVLHRIPVPCVALTTMIISLDRGRVARNPMNCSYSISPGWKILFIWSFSLLIVTPLAFTRTYDPCIPLAYKCSKVLLFGEPSFSMLYGIAYLMSVHIIPAVILIRESVKTQKIMKFLKLSNIEHLHLQLQYSITPYNTSSLSDNRLRLLRNSCLFTTIFLVFWLPYGIFQFPLDLPKALLPDLMEIYIRFYFRFVRNITYLQIALNPVVLFALSYDLRKYLARVDCDFSWRQQMRGRYNNNNNNNTRYNSHNHILRMNQRPP